MVLEAKIKKGRFTITNNKPKFNDVIFSNNREIPVAPPSIKLFGNKKPFNPNPAENTPIIIKIYSFIAWDIST